MNINAYLCIYDTESRWARSRNFTRAHSEMSDLRHRPSRPSAATAVEVLPWPCLCEHRVVEGRNAIRVHGQVNAFLRSIRRVHPAAILPVVNPD